MMIQPSPIHRNDRRRLGGLELEASMHDNDDCLVVTGTALQGARILLCVRTAENGMKVTCHLRTAIVSNTTQTSLTTCITLCLCQLLPFYQTHLFILAFYHQDKHGACLEFICHSEAGLFLLLHATI